MSARIRLEPPPRERRSHAERTAETRAKVMGAVVESIAEVGFQRTTASEIARRAGVSWGAVQHHFGGKDGILVAVVEDSFNHFAERLSGVEVEGLPLDARVARFVDGAWEHFGSARYRSTLEILLNTPAREGSDWQAHMLDAWNRIWRRFFPPGGRSPREIRSLQLYTIAVLSGLATANMIGGPQPRLFTGPLALLKQTLEERLAPAR
ncbi:MAG: TetR/AcrR family transcriptional regulator [Myxococcales bacterium]|nr:TetR/AcrR family transcriptional regulator [Myxococcales bacterium]